MNERPSLSRLAGRPIVKMNGVGNAILVLDLRGGDIVVTGDEARAIAASPGLSFDQLMTIHDPREPDTDAHLFIYNNDGSLAGACGNGTRCVGWVMLRGSDRDKLVLTTSTARVTCTRVEPLLFAVDMGHPSFRWDEIPLRDATLDHKAVDLGAAGTVTAAFGAPFALGMGNPHAIFFVPDIGALDLAQVGAPVEHASAFPERVNVSFAEIVDVATIKLRVWERGAGETLGCGTGACATLVAAAATGRTGRSAAIELPGGRLQVSWREDGSVLMTGPVELEGETILDAALFEGLAA